MAKRGGKAASRRSRQRRPQRSAPPSPQREPQQPAAADEAGTVVESPSAFDKADAEVRAMANTNTRGPTRSRARPPAVPYGTAGPSRLSDQAVSEYHYVLRDLRNIGVLMVILTVVLLVATVVVNALGIGPG
jgi:hypothetical protein